MPQINDEGPIDPAELIRLGTVASVNLGTGNCTVEVGDIVTPAIPWIEPRMGATRTWSPPTVGEQVLLICPESELGLAVALRGIPSNSFPVAGTTLEELIEFSDGARIAYDPESHRLTATLPAGSTVAITAETVTIDGDVTVTGTVTADVDVIGGGKSLKTHRHSGTQPGGGQSGPPA
ncbi:MAG: phage baseplate assembly protein V [Pseudomonadota bacterium]